MIQKVEEHWNCDIEMEENERNHVLKLYRETMLQAYNFGFEVKPLFPDKRVCPLNNFLIAL